MSEESDSDLIDYPDDDAIDDPEYAKDEDDVGQEAEDAENDDDPSLRWSSKSLSRLFSRVKAAVSSFPDDSLYDSYVQEEVLDWNRVAFNSFTADECKRRWSEESKACRRFRYLSEIVDEVASNRGVDLANDETLDDPTDAATGGVETRSRIDPPPKPSTALQLFVNSVRDKLEMQSKSRRITAHAYGHIVKSWKQHPEPERLVFIRRAMENWKAYEKKVEAYKKLNPRYKAFQCTVTKEERALLDKVSGKPARPAGSAYVLFLKDTLPTLKAYPAKDRMGVVSKLWTDLADDKRTIYQEKFEELQKEYRNACIKYELDPSRGAALKRKATAEDAASTAEESKSSVSGDDAASNAFAFFSQMVGPVLKKEGDDDIEERLTKMWKELSTEERRVYEVGSSSSAGSGGAWRMNAKDARNGGKTTGLTETEEAEQAQERIVRQLLAGAPKKPPSCAYHLFLRDSYPKVTDLPQKERTRLLARHWTHLPAVAKKPFALRTAEMQRQYDLEFATFLQTVPVEVRDLARQRAMEKRRPPQRSGRKRLKTGDEAASTSVNEGSVPMEDEDDDDVDDEEFEDAVDGELLDSHSETLSNARREEDDAEATFHFEAGGAENDDDDDGDEDEDEDLEEDEEDGCDVVDAENKTVVPPLKISVKGFTGAGAGARCGDGPVQKMNRGVSDTETESGEDADA